MEERWRAFFVVAIAVFIASLDLFIVNIAFPDIQADFAGASLSELSWVLNAYAIVYAALLVPAGRLGDVLGRKRMFMTGLALFLAGSALCAAAPSTELLVAARVVQAAGAAAITPNSLGVLLPLFPPERRAGVIGAWAALGALGAALGPPVGGLLVEASWRWIFLVTLPLGGVALVMARHRLREVREPGAALPDGLGSALLVASVALLTLGLAQGPDWDWDGRVVASFAGAVVLGAAFLLRCARHRAPVLELSLLRVPSFALAGGATLLFFAGFAAMLLGNILFLTTVWDYSVLKAGFATAPGPAMAGIFAALSGRLGDRMSPALMGAPGGLLFGLGAVWWLTRLGADPDFVADYLPGQLIGGAGVGLMLPALTATAVSTLPPARLATGLGVQTTFRQIGSALGVAVWVALVESPTGVDAFDAGFVLMGAGPVAAGVAMLAATARKPAPEPVAEAA